ncbi:hypothetical protein RB594_004067 [Gaeumannomyces avenae]
MELPKTKPDAVLDPPDAKCPGYRNKNTARWDGSQIYGSSEAGNPLTGFHSNWRVDMEMLHTLFALEHNSLYDELRGLHPGWTGYQVFDKAQLINCALMAKIHTAELMGRVSRTSEIISGIPGSGVEHDGVPYSLTEEFVSIYRMHSPILDDVAFFSASRGNGQHVATTPMRDLAFEVARKPLEGGKDALSFTDLFYSFGINYSGAITNNNYPSFLRDFTDPDGVRRDLGTVDILRDRERGVPRYCDFRRLLRLDVPLTFLDITVPQSKELADRLSEAYGGDVTKRDGVPDFILMASRRLKSDRFIAGQQWDEETHTREGLRWVQGTSMKDVLARHFPELAGTLGESEEVSAPWAKMEGSKGYKGKEANAPGK